MHNLVDIIGVCSGSRLSLIEYRVEHIPVLDGFYKLRELIFDPEAPQLHIKFCGGASDAGCQCVFPLRLLLQVLGGAVLAADA